MKLLLILLAPLYLNTCGTRAHAQSYSAIYVFGDSFCDTGNIWLATSGQLPAAPYYQGRFSNGPLWVEQVAAQFPLPVTPVLEGGTNFAFGGARLLQNDAIPSVSLQVDTYLYLNGGNADPNALYILEGGTNDIFFSNGESPAQLGYSIAASLASLEAKLNSAGATHFLLVNVPDVGMLPYAHQTASFATAASVSANLSLQLFVFTAEFTQGIHIDVLDMFSFIDNTLAQPADAGFINSSAPCLSDDGEVCADPDQMFFWDTVHPSAAANSTLAGIAEAAIHP